MKPNCYKCKWKGNNPGDAHIRCKHPSLGSTSNDPLLEIMAMFASVGRESPIGLNCNALNIKANFHGIEKGWFNFPWNFDPIWLENCDGFIPENEV